MRTQISIEPSGQAFRQVRSLASDAVSRDGWMVPVFDRHLKEPDFGQFAGYHRDGWEETDHFTILYREAIGSIALEEAHRFGVGRRPSEDGKMWLGGYADWEAYHYGIFQPLVDEFWETWESEHHFYMRWEAAKFNLFTGVYWPGTRRG